MLKLNSELQLFAKTSDLKINDDAIFKFLGYDTENIDEFVKEKVSECIIQCEHLYKPAASIIFKEISEVEGSFVVIDGTSLSTKPIISNQLKGAQYAAIFISTIGNGPELLSKELFDKGDGLEAYILSLVASEAADSHAAYIHKHIEHLAKAENMKITNRFSPGYCRWDVAEQKKLFSFFRNNTSGVTLNDSALMNPIKSVSGIIGIGTNATLKEYPCKSCTEDMCLYRKK